MTLDNKTTERSKKRDHLVAQFAPILGNHPQVLILGTAPSVASLAIGQYYGHAHNAFWPIMLSYNKPQTAAKHLSIDYQTKCALLKTQGIAVWDVLASCSRQGSLDSSIKLDSIVVNPIEELVAQTNSINAILCNGKKSYQWLQRYIVKPNLNLFNGIALLDMPSTSPAYASMSLLEKTTIWHGALKQYL